MSELGFQRNIFISFPLTFFHSVKLVQRPCWQGQLILAVTTEFSKYDLSRHESPSSSVVRAPDRCTRGHGFDSPRDWDFLFVRSWDRFPLGLRFLVCLTLATNWIFHKYSIFLKVAPYSFMTARALMMWAVVICARSHEIVRFSWHFMTSA